VIVGPTLFAALLWGALLAVAVVLAYEVYAVGREFGVW
jgi:hypothetical protein